MLILKEHQHGRKGFTFLKGRTFLFHKKTLFFISGVPIALIGTPIILTVAPIARVGTPLARAFFARDKLFGGVSPPYITTFVSNKK